MSRYREAGVDIDAAALSVESIKKLAQSTYTPGVLSGIGGFSGLFQVGSSGEKDLVLAAGADGVGTKILVAQQMGKHDTVGIDLVAMNCDDIVTSGARPFFFLDYIAVGKLDSDVVTDLVKGVAQGCQLAGCALLGGETAEMPGVYEPGQYDLAGFCVGGCQRGQIVDGSKIKEGDVLIGLESSGLHSNGYSLARRVLLEDAKMPLNLQLPELGRTLGEELLEPTRVYAKCVQFLQSKVDVKGMAHITGGGLLENIPRVLPAGLSMKLSCRWRVPPIFELIQKTGQIPTQEMYRVFNMGVGMVVIVDPAEADSALRASSQWGINGFILGEVTKNDQ